MWDVVLTSGLAVTGTLLGSWAAGRQQGRLQERTRREQRAEERHRQSIADIANLQAALADHRRTMTLLRHALVTGAGDERLEELRAQSHETRARITPLQVRVKLMLPELAERVDAAVAAVYGIDQSVRTTSTPELDALEAARQAARDASDVLTVAASEILRPIA